MFRPGLDKLPVYGVEEQDWRIKVDANESNRNLPPLVAERVEGRLSYVAFNRYPDIAMTELREEIGRGSGYDIDNVWLGNGSSEILEKLFFLYGGVGRSIVFPVPSFSMYAIYAKISESTAVPVPLEADYTVDKEKMLRAAEEHDAKLIVLCNPNNPTGTATPLTVVEDIVRRAKCPVVVDEAYMEFYGETALPLVAQYPNLIVARTFSKAYGAAGIRAGYVIANEDVIAMLRKISMPYHINKLTLTVAETIFQMRDEFIPYIQQTIIERERMAAFIETETNITVYPSSTNFLLFKVEGAGELAKYLANIGIAVRSFANAPMLENCIRITIGTTAENDEIMNAIKRWCKGAK